MSSVLSSTASLQWPSVSTGSDTSGDQVRQPRGRREPLKVTSKARYHVYSRYGQWGLSIAIRDVSAGDLSPLEHAIYLGAVPTQIEWLESWLGERLRIEPANTVDNLPVVATIHTDDANTEVSLTCSPSMLPGLPVQDRALCATPGISVSWKSLAVEIELARYRLSTPEALQLDNGALLVLPTTDSTARLLFAGEPFEVMGRFDVERLAWTAEDSTSSADRSICSSDLQEQDFYIEACLKTDHQLSLDALPGLSEGDGSLALSHCGGDTIRCRLEIDTGQVYSGSFLAVGAGAVFIIDTDLNASDSAAVYRRDF